MLTQEFYSYLWLRQNDTPYYAGKGHNNRAYIKHWNGGRFLYPPKDKSKILVFPQLSEHDAFECEKWFIRIFKRKDQHPDGLLLNLTDGGEGISGLVHSEETRAKLSAANTGKTLSPESRARISAARTGKIHSEETKAKIGASNKGKTRSEESRIKMRAAHKGRTPSIETRTKLSAANKGRTLSPEHRAKISAAQKQRYESPEERAKMSERMKGKQNWLGRKHTEESKLKMSTALKGNQNPLGHKHTEESKTKMSIAAKQRWESPEYRTKMSEQMKGNKIAACIRWNIRRNKPCVCGQHLERAA